MKIIAVLCFALGGVFLLWTVMQVTTRGWGPLDVSVHDVYFVVEPRYLLLISVALLIGGFVSVFVPHP